MFNCYPDRFGGSPRQHVFMNHRRDQCLRPQYVARPPEISNTAPVENAQSSEASHATIAASSSTRTKRPFGIFEHEVDMLLRHLVEDRGPGGGGGHRVDGDFVTGEFLSK